MIEKLKIIVLLTEWQKGKYLRQKWKYLRITVIKQIYGLHWYSLYHSLRLISEKLTQFSQAWIKYRKSEKYETEALNKLPEIGTFFKKIINFTTLVLNTEFPLINNFST